MRSAKSRRPTRYSSSWRPNADTTLRVVIAVVDIAVSTTIAASSIDLSKRGFALSDRKDSSVFKQELGLK